MNVNIRNSNKAPDYIPDYPTIHGPVEHLGVQSFYIWSNKRVGWSKIVAGDTVKLPTGSGMVSAHNGQIILVNNEHIHTQDVPLSEWVIEHKFGRHPSYYTVESNDKVVDCAIKHSNQYTSANFANPTSGTIVLGF